MLKREVSIRGIISISFILLMIGTLLTIGTIIFSNWHASTENMINKMEEEKSKDIVNEIDSLFHTPIHMNEINKSLIVNKVVDIQNKESRDTFLASILNSSNEQIYSVTYGMETGEFYGARRNSSNKIEIYRSTPETNGHSYYYSVTEDLKEGEFLTDYGKFDPRTRPWYIMAKETGKPIHPPLYKLFVNNEMILSFAHPVYSNEGKFQGVLATHMTLSRLNEYLKNVVSNNTASAYVVERITGEMVANSQGTSNVHTESDGTLSRRTLDNLGNEPILEAYNQYKKNFNVKMKIEMEDENLHLKFTEYKRDGLDWLIITSISDKLYTEEVRHNIKTAAILSILAIIISMLIYKKSTDIILKPINHLILAAERFSKGDLLQKAIVYKNDEIGKLASAFNKMADELYKHINHLEEKVKERTTEIEKTNLELKQAKTEADKANEAKSDFLANMSHEIRTPLNAIIGLSEVLQNKIQDEKQQNYLKTIHIAGNSLLMIINDILDLSKIEAGMMEILYKPIKSKQIFKEIEAIFIENIHRKGIDFIIDIEDDLPELILFDEVRMRQILLNLVGNAVKFTDKGYVKLSLKAKPSLHNSDFVDLHLSVEDTGIGIPPLQWERIFEAFTQISGQSIKKYGGTGLGLSITKKLVEMMNGQITIESTVGKGSIFHVKFPYVKIADVRSMPDDTENHYFPKSLLNDDLTESQNEKENLGIMEKPSHKDHFSSHHEHLSPEILNVLQSQVLPLLQQIESSLIVSNVINLAQLLINLGNQHDSKFMTTKGEELMRYAECFDIVKIKCKIKQIYQVIIEDRPNGK